MLDPIPIQDIPWSHESRECQDPADLGLFAVGLWPSHLSSATGFPTSSMFCPKQPKTDASITNFPPASAPWE